MVSKEKSKTYHQYGKGVNKGKRVPKSIYSGSKRRTPAKQYRCSKCNSYFKDLAELNLHYTARADHKRKPPQSKRLKVKSLSEFSPEQQEQLAAVGELLFDKRKFEEKMREFIQTRLKEKMERASRTGYW